MPPLSIYLYRGKQWVNVGFPGTSMVFWLLSQTQSAAQESSIEMYGLCKHVVCVCCRLTVCCWIQLSLSLHCMQSAFSGRIRRRRRLVNLIRINRRLFIIICCRWSSPAIKVWIYGGRWRLSDSSGEIPCRERIDLRVIDNEMKGKLSGAFISPDRMVFYVITRVNNNNTAMAKIIPRLYLVTKAPPVESCSQRVNDRARQTEREREKESMRRKKKVG